MFTLKNYIRPESMEEAYELCLKKSNKLAGGMLWLKMSEKNYNTLIDLCDLGLDKTELTGGYYHIGAYVSLRELEKDSALNSLTGNLFSDALKNIVGVQFRNCATVGGSIFGRFGFSDVLTAFSVLDTRVKLYKAGTVSLEEFMKMPRNMRDILTEIIIPDKKIKAAFTSMRITATDFPVLNCAVSKNGDNIKCAVGARPLEAEAVYDEEGILKDGINPSSAEKFAAYAADKFTFGSNMRGSAEYRKKICPVLIARAVMKLSEDK